MQSTHDPYKKEDFPAEDVDAELTLGAFYAKTVMDRHEVPRNQRSKLVSQVTGLQYGAAHRRTRGDLPWTFEELLRLALHFGENLEQVFFEAGLLVATPGEFVVGGFRRNCHFWRGKRLSANTPRDTLAAKVIRSTWIVSPFGEHAPGDDIYEAKHPLLEHAPDLTFRIAVLDDMPEAASAVRKNLIAAKMKCEVFHSISALRTEVESRPFDGYVLDWLIDGDDVRELIGYLRQTDATAPIFILTGQATSNAGIPPHIGAMELAHGARYYSKTSETSVMVSILRVHLNARARAAST